MESLSTKANSTGFLDSEFWEVQLTKVKTVVAKAKGLLSDIYTWREDRQEGESEFPIHILNEGYNEYKASQTPALK